MGDKREPLVEEEDVDNEVLIVEEHEEVLKARDEVKEEKVEKDNTYLKGAILINISVACMAFQSLFSKLVLERVDALQPIELFAMRQTTTLVLWILVINKHLKHFLYDNITKEDLKSLVLRSVFGTSNTYFNLQNANFFPLTFVGVSLNLVPITTVTLSRIFLKDKLTGPSVVRLIIALIGVVIIVVSHTEEKGANKVAYPWFAWFGLAFVPLGMGSSTVLMKKMKKVHFVAVGMYNFTFQIPFIIIWFSINQFPWNMVNSFGWQDFALVFGAAVGQQAYSTFKFFALKFVKASQVAPFQYLVIFYQLFFDLVIFKKSFQLLTWGGLAVMIIGFGGTILYEQKTKKKEVKKPMTEVELNLKAMSVYYEDGENYSLADNDAAYGELKDQTTVSPTIRNLSVAYGVDTNRSGGSKKNSIFNGSIHLLGV